MAIKKLVKKNEELKAKAEANTTTSIKKGKEEPTVLKQGNPLDHSTKQEQRDAKLIMPQRVGMSKGITKNMENFESFRVDCWLTDTLQEDESEQEALDRLSKIIDAQIQLEVEKVIEE